MQTAEETIIKLRFVPSIKVQTAASPLASVSSISELLSLGDKRWRGDGGGQTNLMRDNTGAILLFSDALLPVDAWRWTGLCCAGRVSHLQACWAPF